MSINFNTIKVTSLLTVLCLSTSLTMTSCKKDKVAEAPGEPAKTAAGAVKDAAGAAGGAATGAAAGAAGAVKDAAGAVAGTALSPEEKTKLAPVKGALVMANTAVKAGDMTKAKAQFEKFSGMWTAVEPMVKAKAGASFPAIEAGIKMVTTAMGSGDKAKATEGLGMAMKAIDAVTNKK